MVTKLNLLKDNKFKIKSNINMEIIIPAEEHSCIRKKLNINLEKYTVLAGVNNSGKTSIVRAIINHKDLGDYEKIYIPAENIKPKEGVLKNTASGDSFYKIIEDILNPIFKGSILDDLIKKFDESSDKVDFIRGVNNILRNFGVDKKELDIKIPQDKFKEGVIIKIAEGIVKDLYKTEIKEVNIDDVGMGTQRLIIAALIQYYERNKMGNDKKTLLIIEEPEIYLHPKWKSSLHNALIKLSETENIKVLITTHDPYFIDMAKGQKIYRIFRNESHNDATDIEEIKKNDFLLPYKSSSEINYFIFELPTKTYFLELYEHIFDLFKAKEGIVYENSELNEFNKWIISQISSKTVIRLKGPNNPQVSSTRHSIGHPRETVNITPEDLKKGIEEMKILHSLLKQTKVLNKINNT